MADDAILEAEDATHSEERRYEKAYRETRRALDESLQRLAVLKELEMDPDVRSDIGEQMLELKRSRADLVRANLAFHTGRAVMQPPSPELVNEIVANSKEVVELTVERATVAALVKIATKALTKFAEIHDINKTRA